MSVGKESLKRAASAAEVKTEEGKATEAAKKVETAPVAPVEKTAPVKKTTRGRKAAGTKAATTKTTTRKTTKSSVKKAVLTPENSEEIRGKFVSGEKPVHINEELPVYLL